MKRKKNKYTREQLETLAKDSLSIASMLRALGLQQAGGTHRWLKSKLRALNIDTSHFTGAIWSKGLTKETNHIIAEQALRATIPDNEVFIENSTYTDGSKIRRRLIKLGWEYKCLECSINSWNGKPLILHIDHINGINNDNRLENLRFLCPNCHQQTPTWGNKKPRSSRKKLTKESQTRQKREPKIKVRKKCARPNRSPDKDTLKNLVWAMPTTKVAQQFGVSDKAVEKWCKNLGVDKPPRGYWTKQKAL